MRLLRDRQVAEMIGLSRASVWRMARNGHFPEPVRIAERSTRWLERDVNAWIEARATQRRGQP